MGNFCCQDIKQSSPVKQNYRNYRRDINTHKKSHFLQDYNSHEREETSSSLKIEELALKPAHFYKEKIGIPL